MMVIQEDIRKLRDVIETMEEKLCALEKGADEVQKIQRVTLQEEEGISKDLERCSQKEPEMMSAEDISQEYNSNGGKATKKS